MLKKLRMNYKIENDVFEIGITEIGGELCSFKSKKTAKEYIWQAEPEIWGSHAPVLFPIVGGLKNNTFFHNDKEYSLPRHGFIRRNESLKVIEQSTNSIIIQLLSNPKTLESYPFHFDFQIQFSLKGNKLNIAHKVINKGNDIMPFSLGAHPAFNCPLNESESYNDYYIEFQQEEDLNTWELNQEGLISHEGKKILHNSKVIKLHAGLFKNDALIFKSLKSKEIKLASRKSSQEIIVQFHDFKSLGLWAKPQASFVCIEPWLGYADSENTTQILSEKEGIILLKPQEEFNASYSIEIRE